MIRIRSLHSAFLAVAIGLAGIAGSASAQTSPPLQIPVATLNVAMRCTSSPGLAGATKAPVLLVHGTAVNAEANWSANYWKVLPAKGHPVCTVDLPDRALADIQDSAEYVVNAVRNMYAASGRKISIIGHSQGGLLGAWVMKFWPDLTPMVDDVIGLGAPYKGTAGALACIATQSCAPAAWQMRSTSNLVAAFNRKPLPVGPSFTSVLSTTDEVVTLQPFASTLDGGATLAIQARCARAVGHISLVMDSVAYDVVMDALKNPGPASLIRLPLGTCLGTTVPGSDLPGWTLSITQGLLEAFTTLITQPSSVQGEPPLRAYAY